VTSKPDDTVDDERRAFLRGSFLRKNTTGKNRRERAPLGPPPPALTPELARTQPCIGCPGPCVESCEAGIILRHPEGHALAGLAYLSFDHAGCTFCNDCVEGCRLQTGDALVTRLGTAQLDRDACIAWDGVICMSCRLACTDAAIVMDRRSRPSVDEDACTGCGLCVSVCPPRAIRVTF